MDRERGRGRVRTRRDGASSIDFSILNPKLEEDLAAGRAAASSPSDLITMFLEQAVFLNQKIVKGSIPDNIADRHQPCEAWNSFMSYLPDDVFQLLG
ncbi:hypothetical protein R1sor_002786 [Riccia sorocarpa]|uniref:Uncharacterized protein n=1 Tax=Riccia sorocarpa TaxID=122646 RepID=A0ABD3H2I2_9MARC